MKRSRAFADHVTTALAGVAALTLVGVCVWHLSNPEGLPPVVAPVANAAPLATPAASAARPDYGEIAGWHLFGEPADDLPVDDQTVVEVPGSESLENLPSSAVALQVTGTVTASTAGAARAVIMDSAGRQTDVAIGDQLPGNIKLYAIERGRIVVRRNGALEAIALPQAQELMLNRDAVPAAPTNPPLSTPESNLTSYNND